VMSQTCHMVDKQEETAVKQIVVHLYLAFFADI
jgi:hypothetical protein